MLPAPDIFIGISEDRLHHILGVARKCYQLAQHEGFDEDFCRKMFLLGWLHDVGYEFAEENYAHSYVSAEMAGYLSPKDKNAIEAIKRHGGYPSTPVSNEARILISADMTTDSKGNDVSVMARLDDIRDRYGDYSDEYLTACDMCYLTGLTAINLAGNVIV